MRIFVLNKKKQPLMPCTPARARMLLSKGKAVVLKQVPFTIILLDREEGVCQNIVMQIDPGSKVTGVTLARESKTSHHLLWAAELVHRGVAIKKALEQRRAIRRSRRARHTRYRASRFSNRKKPSGWLPPSIKSRIDNVYYFTKKLKKLVPITHIAVETVRFDMQKMEDPEISGVSYQQGTLFGYEVREYLLEKWKRKCAYCSASNTRLEIDHITPKSLGGTNRVDNLAICCRPCNELKGNRPLDSFLKNMTKASSIISASKKTLKDAAAVNASRKAIGQLLMPLGPISFHSGGQTKYNRIRHGFPKQHWIDAACILDSQKIVNIPNNMSILEIQATGRGSRQQCLVNRFGFPRSSAKQKKRVFGFQTGDFVSAFVPTGKKQGSYKGKVAVRSTGNFNIKTKSGIVEGIQAKHCRLIQNADGYAYKYLKQEQHFLSVLKDEVSALSI